MEQFFVPKTIFLSSPSIPLYIRRFSSKITSSKVRVHTSREIAEFKENGFHEGLWQKKTECRNDVDEWGCWATVRPHILKETLRILVQH